MERGLISSTSLEAALIRARRLISSELSVQQLVVFCAVYNGGSRGIEQGTLVATYGLSRSHVSKTVADLSARTSSKQHGPDLIRSDMDPNDHRLRIITATTKGEHVMRQILGEKP